MTTSTVDNVKSRIQLVRELSNELAAYLYTLPDDVWREAEQYGSPCEPWKVADVVTHLISGASTYALSVSRALKGDSKPPMGHRPRTDEERLESLVSLRVAYYEDLFPEFNASCKRLNTLLIDLEPEQYDAPVWHPLKVIPISHLINFRVLELAVHGWDVRYPFDRDAKLHQKAVPFLKEWLPLWMRTGYKRGDAFDSPIRYRFELTDAFPEAYDFVSMGDKCKLVTAEDADVDVTFKCDTNTYLLFGFRHIPFARSVRRGRIAFEGDEELAAQFTNLFRPL